MKDKLLWIPRNALKTNLEEEESKGSSLFSSSKTPKLSTRPPIPCLYIPENTFGSSKLLLYFHGNAEDIGYSEEFLRYLVKALKINVLAMEYPSYGIYTEEGGCSDKKIKEDAEYMYRYVK